MSDRRTTEQRKSDVLAVFGRNGDAWLATAGGSGRPHLIAVATWWDGSDLVVATRAGSRTARNLGESRSARLALGTPDDAVIVDAQVSATSPAAGPDADDTLAAGFAAAAGWNPAEQGPDWGYFRLHPVRIQAYRGYGELEGRDVMREGRWLA